MKKITLLAVTFLSFFIFQQKAVFADTGFAKPNLSGSWYVYITVSEITKTVVTTETTYVTKPGYVKGVVEIDKNGNVVSSKSQLTYFDFQADPNEGALDITGGNMILAKNGTITGAIQIGNGAEYIQIVDSKMDKGKTIISGIVKNIATAVDSNETVATIGMFSAIKR